MEFAAELLVNESVGLEVLDRLRREPTLSRTHVFLLDLALDRLAAVTSEQPMPQSGHSHMIARTVPRRLQHQMAET
jgi:hypothetical protein